MARPKATIPTERLCVTIPADEVKAAKKAAFVAGVTWADFVRQALLSQAAVERGYGDLRPTRPVAGEGGCGLTPRGRRSWWRSECPLSPGAGLRASGGSAALGWDSGLHGGGLHGEEGWRPVGPAVTLSPRAKHECHATGCDVAVPRRMFMCRHHWYRLPKHLRDAVWETYAPGQESRMDPSREYLDASRRAIEWLENLEGK